MLSSFTSLLVIYTFWWFSCFEGRTPNESHKAFLKNFDLSSGVPRPRSAWQTQVIWYLIHFEDFRRELRSVWHLLCFKGFWWSPGYQYFRLPHSCWIFVLTCQHSAWTCRHVDLFRDGCDPGYQHSEFSLDMSTCRSVPRSDVTLDISIQSSAWTCGCGSGYSDFNFRSVIPTCFTAVHHLNYTFLFKAVCRLKNLLK